VSLLKTPLFLQFSYPCDQHAIDQGLLLRWTKGFSAPSVENHDVGELFRKALAKYPDMPVKFTSLINDTTGTLIASAYVDTRTRIGCIFGTGCNAAYIEKVGNITKLKTRQKEWESVDKDAEIAINCEWVRCDFSKALFATAEMLSFCFRAHLTHLNMNTYLGLSMI
jgi:hexokinase